MGRSLRIAVLANERSWYWREISRAAVSVGHQIERIEFDQISVACGTSRPQVQQREVELSEFDAIVVRTMPPGSLEQVVFRMDALLQLQQAGVAVINPPKSIECATDKFLTTARLEAAGLTVPRTIVCQDSESSMRAFDELGRDVVVKPIFGSEGRGICRVSDVDLAFRTFRTLERTGAVLYLQEFIQHPGFDVRVLVLRGRVLGGMKRFGADGDFRTNCSRQGRGEPHSPTQNEIDLALRATAACGAIFAGIDLLYDGDGRCFVIEVNAVPGWQAFNRVNNVDIADVMIRDISENL